MVQKEIAAPIMVEIQRTKGNQFFRDTVSRACEDNPILVRLVEGMAEQSSDPSMVTGTFAIVYEALERQAEIDKLEKDYN